MNANATSCGFAILGDRTDNQPMMALETVPGWRRLIRFTNQLLQINPFDGDVIPGRVRLFQLGSGRPSLPFPHRWNYQEPIRILDAYFWGADDLEPAARHNRFLDCPGFPTILVTRDPAIIRAILTATGDREEQFDRDTMPSTGIARATGKDTLLFSNGPFWRRQRKVAATPFGKTALFQNERFEEFSATARANIYKRLAVLKQYQHETGESKTRLKVEPEIKAVMLDMLVNCFFGAEVEYHQIRNEFVPSFERVIDHIVKDTVSNRLGIPVRFRAFFSSHYRAIQADLETMEELTDLVLAARKSERGLWKYFKSDAPDELLRSNIKVLLAGALEATTSYATWAISHLARNQAAQEKLFQELQSIDYYTTENLGEATYLGQVLDETLRLTPSLYFLPRHSTTGRWITLSDDRRIFIPSGTHILLDVWHANRHKDHWGIENSGYPADEFAPERWEYLAERKRSSKDALHFGFGYGARVCPGKHLGQLEVALIVGAFVKLFRFEAPEEKNEVRAGVSTKPRDGTLVELEPRFWPEELQSTQSEKDG